MRPRRSTCVSTSPLNTTIVSSHALGGVAHRARRAERRRLDDVAELDAGVASIAKDFFDAVRLIVEAEDDFVDFGHLLDEIELIVEKRAG